MAPATANPAVAERNASGKTVPVPAPAQGAALAVPSSPGGELELAFDPGAATASRQGDSLVFEVDGGGTVTISDFFVVGDESLPALRLPDGTVVASADFFEGSDLDMTTAAGPTAAAPGSGGTSYEDGAGYLMGGVDRLGTLGTDYWSRSTEAPEAPVDNAVPDLTFGVGLLGGLADALTQNMNESDSGSALNLAFTLPLITGVTLVFTVGGNADALTKSGMEEFRADYLIDTAGAIGCTAVFDADSGTLTLTIPPGTQTASVPVNFIDDHINDGAKSITFTLSEATGNITAPAGVVATIVISDDSGAHAHDPNNPNETDALDGPIVGLTNAGVEELYEAHPETNEFRFALAFTDPHSGEAYEGYTSRSGQSDFTLSQDMTITLEPGGAAGHGFDYEFDFREISDLPGVKSVSVDAEGRISIELQGRVDENGVPHGPSVTPYTFAQGQELVVIARVLVNSDNSDATGSGQRQDGEEGRLFLSVVETSGNESQWDPAPVEVVIAEDPMLSIELATPDAADQTINESAKEFSLLLAFDKNIAAGAEVTVVLKLEDYASTPLASLWNSAAAGADGQKYLGDFGLPSGATAVADASGNLTITFRGADINGDGLTLTFPLIDDHITEGTEAVTFTVASVTIKDARNEPADHDHAPGAVGGAGDGDHVIITDDDTDTTDNAKDLNEKDGPVISVLVDNAATLEGTEEALQGEHTFSIILKDPYSGNDYTGFEHTPGQTTGTLSQDITFTISIGGGADAGSDYSLDFSLLKALMEANKITVDAANLDAQGAITPDANGAITITLHGQVNASGEPAGHEAVFTVPGDLGSLKIGCTIIDDLNSERESKTIEVDVVNPGGGPLGNESKLGEGAEIVLNPDKESEFNGPEFSLQNTQTTYESRYNDKVNQNPSTTHGDPAYERDHNVATHTIGMSTASTEVIRAVITLGGGTATRHIGSESPTDATWGKADYAFQNGSVQFFNTGTNTWETLAEDQYSYNPATGKLSVKIPAGTQGLRFDVDINDDLYETTEVNDETYTVSLELVYTDAAGRHPGDEDYDPATALPDGEASIAAGRGQTTVTIVEDQRTDGPGTDANNPSTFDGPWVSIGVLHEGGSLTTHPADKTVQESGGEKITFQLSLLDPAGTGDLYGKDGPAHDKTVEPVTVTLKFSGDDGFFMSDLFKPGPGGSFDFASEANKITVKFYSADGTPVEPSGTLDIPGSGLNSWTAEFQASLTVPPGAAYATFEVPVNDDPVGKGQSALDKGSETFTVELVGVTGNEARIDSGEGKTSAGATITEDGADQYDGVKVGLVWNDDPATSQKWADDGKYLKEGQDYTFAVKLYDKSGTPITGSANNPYVGYQPTGKPSGALPEDMAITLTLSDTKEGEGDDVTYTLGTGLRDLIRAGKVTVTIGDTEYTTVTALEAYMAGHEGLNGKITLTLVAGEFNVSSDYNKITFVANVHGDNVNEFDHQGRYDGDSGLETIEVKITDVSGNESSPLGGKTQLDGAITDMADGELTLTGGTWDGREASWDFEIALAYPDAEKANDHPTTPNYNGDILRLPGETVHTQIRITDSGDMQQGDEYKVDAFSLFRSLNKIQVSAGGAFEGLPEGVTDLDSYYGWLEAQSDLENYDGLFILVKDSGGFAESWDGEEGLTENLYDIYVPKGCWTTNPDGSCPRLEFAIERGDDHSGGLHADREGFAVEIVTPRGEQGHILNQGEIVKSNEGDAVVAGPPLDKISITLVADKTSIVEDTAVGGDVSSIVTHTVTFGFVPGGEAPMPESGWKAAADFGFDLTLRGKGLFFDTDLTDNYLDHQAKNIDGTNMTGVGDLAMAVGEYADINDMLGKLNEHLAAQAGEGPKASVTGIDITGNGGDLEIVFKVEVEEGYDLSKGVTLPFKALDDSSGDDGEAYTLTVSNVTSDGNKLNVVIAQDRQDTVTINDESAAGHAAYRNGYALAVRNTSGNEAGTDGGDKYIDVPVLAFILGDADNNDYGIAANKPMTLEMLAKLYASDTANGGTRLTEADLASMNNGGEMTEPAQAFYDYINAHYKPFEPITVNYKLTGKGEKESDGEVSDHTAQNTFDYMSSSSKEIGTGAWGDAVIDADGNVYFQTKSGMDTEGNGWGLQIETIKDHYQEGDETIGLELTGASGNEARPVDEDDFGEASATYPNASTVTIKDVLDGPVLISFGPNAKVIYEPIDFEHGPVGDVEHKAEGKDVTYSVRLDSAASEPVMVWMDLKTGDGYASMGENGDFILGEGIYYYDAENDKVFSFPDNSTQGTLKEFWKAHCTEPSYDDAAAKYLSTGEPGYFTIILKDQASAEFTVKVLDDNADETGETIGFIITGMEGSEVRYENTAGDKRPWADNPKEGSEGHFVYDSDNADIKDDLRGPEFAVDAQNNRIEWSGKELEDLELTVTLEDYISDDSATLALDIRGSDGASIGTLTLTLDADALKAAVEEGLKVNLYDELKSAAGTGAWEPVSGEPSTIEAIAAKLGHDFFVQLTGSTGGESRHSDSIIYMDKDDGVSIVLDNFTSNTIHEGVAGEKAEYRFELDFTTTDSIPETGISFEVKFLPGTATEEDVTVQGDTSLFGTTLTVKISNADLTTMKDNGIKQVTMANGKIGYTNANNEFTPFENGSTITAYDTTGPLENWTFPTATADGLLEGDEQFHAIIVNADGVDIDSAVASTTIKDMTQVGLAILDKNGKLLDPTTARYAEDSGDVTFKVAVVLVDEEGKPILQEDGKPVLVEVNDRLEIEIGYSGADTATSGDGQAKPGEDFTGDRLVYIQPDQSSAEFTVTIHEDYVGEGDETFTITAGLTGEAKEILKDTFGEEGYTNNFIGTETTSPSITIEETLNGPEIKWSVSSAKEDGSMGVSYDSYARDEDIRQVVEEDVKLTFRLEPGDGPALDFLTDIEAVIVRGARFEPREDNEGNIDFEYIDTTENSSQPYQPEDVSITRNDDGTYTLTTIMDKGSAMGGFTIKPFNDNITEGKESIKITLQKVEGSETSVHLSDREPKTAHVEDDGSGYSYEVAAIDGTEGDRGGITITFSGAPEKNAPGETVDVSLTLDGEGLKALDTGAEPVLRLTIPGYGPIAITREMIGNGDEFEYRLDDALYKGSFDLTTGKLTFTLPEGMKNGDVEVEFALKDNSLTGGNPSFEIQDVTVTGGEIQGPGDVSFSSAFKEEQSPGGVGAGGEDGSERLPTGGYTAFTVDAAGDINGIVGEVKFTLQGVDAGIVSRVVIIGADGASKSFSGDGLIDMKLDLDSSYTVQVYYKDGALTAEDKNAIADARAGMSVSAQLEGSSVGVTVPVKNEDGTADNPLDGPTFGLALDPSVTEGKTLNGTLTVTMAGLPGDDYSQGTVEAMTITLQATQNPDGTCSTVRIDDTDYTPNRYGQFTVTLPEGTRIDTDGTISLPISVMIPDNELAKNPEYALTIVSVTGATGDGKHYETHIIAEDGKTATAEVVNEAPADQDGVSFGITNVTQAANGEAASFELGATLLGDLENTTLPEKVTVTLTFTGGTDGHELYVDGKKIGTFDEDGNFEWTVPVNQGTDMQGYAESHTVFVVDGEGKGQGNTLTISVTDVTPAAVNTGSSWEVYGAAEGVSVLTDNYYRMDAGATGDYRNSAEDVVVIGTSGDDTIYGGGGGDTIYGGGGDDIIYAGTGIDILNGGDGDDIFVWAAGNLGGMDIIKDFDYSATGEGGDRISLEFSDIFGPNSETTMDALLQGLDSSTWNDTVKTLLLTDNDGVSELKAVFTEEALRLTIKEGSDTQTIEIQQNESSPFYTCDTLDSGSAQEILEHILKLTTD